MTKDDFHALMQSVNSFERSVDILGAMMTAGLDMSISKPLFRELETIRSAGSTAILRAMHATWALTIHLAQEDIKRIEASADESRAGEIAALQRLLLEMVTARDGHRSETT